ncbi:hypothetical protein Tsubulata_002188, partial [Turnera subulata]
MDIRGRQQAHRRFTSAGHFTAVEELLVVSLPGSGIKAKPHIESRMRTLKTHFSILYDMIAGRGTSGFGWDNDRKCITAENSVWEEYLKSHLDAEPFRYKSFPFYEELSIIFGKDRATGKEALDKQEAPNNENVVDDDATSTSFVQANVFEGGEESSKLKNIKLDTGSQLSKAIKESSMLLGVEIGKATDRLSRALEDTEAIEKRLKINEALTSLSGLTMFERHKSTRKIGCDRETLDIFFTIPEEEKEV